VDNEGKAEAKIMKKSSKAFYFVLSLILIAVIAYFDYITGYIISLMIFYLIPVAISAWWVGKRAGVFIAMLSGATWAFIDVFSGRPYSNVLEIFWNGLVRTFFFLIPVYIIERRKIIKALRDSEEWLSITLKSIGDAVITCNPKGRITFMNPVALELTGWSLDEAKSKLLVEVFNIVNEKTGQPAENPVERVIKEGVVVGLANHTVLITKSGKRISIDDSAAPIRGKTGDILGVILVFRDITLRRRTEDLVQQLLHELQTIFDSVPAWIFYKDKKNRFLRVNKFCTEVMGKKKGELEGKTMFELYPKEQAEAFWRDDLEVIATGKPKLGIIEPVETEKGRRWLQTDKIPYIDESGSIIGIIGFAIDITERRKAEEKVEWLANFPELNPIPICEINLNGEITYINPAADQLLPDLKKLGLKHPWLNGIEAFFEMFARGETNVSLREVKIEHGVYEQNIFYVRDKQRIRIYGFDVTVRKRVAEVIQESAKIKSDFTGMVSHELRTPLSAIKEGVSVVLDKITGDINEEQAHYLNMVKNNVDRLNRLINAVLDFQALESGKLGFKIEEGDINEIVKGIQNTMMPLFKKKGLVFELELCDNLPETKLDSDKIIQVLTNLVNNAIKFTEKGGVTISTSRGDNFIQVVVKDTGTGIKEENMQKLFQEFTQLQRKVGGTGLGLSICKGIIEAHKGKIWAKSEPGKGTAFYFALPIKDRRA